VFAVHVVIAMRPRSLTAMRTYIEQNVGDVLDIFKLPTRGTSSQLSKGHAQLLCVHTCFVVVCLCVCCFCFCWCVCVLCACMPVHVCVYVCTCVIVCLRDVRQPFSFTNNQHAASRVTKQPATNQTLNQPVLPDSHCNSNHIKQKQPPRLMSARCMCAYVSVCLPVCVCGCMLV